MTCNWNHTWQWMWMCLWNATAPVEAARLLTHTPSSSCCNQEHCELIMCYPQAVCIDTDLYRHLKPLGVWLFFYSKLAHFRTVYLRRSHYDSQRMRAEGHWETLLHPIITALNVRNSRRCSLWYRSLVT